MIEILEHRIAPATLAFAIGVGAGGTQSIYDIETDPVGNIYVTGTYMGAVDFDSGPGSVIRTADPGHTDAFVAKFTSIGTLAWVNAIKYSDGKAIAPELTVSSQGDVFIAARYGDSTATTVDFFEGDDDAAPRVQLFQPGTATQVYVVKVDTTGTYPWGQSFGTGAASLDATDIVSDFNGTIYLAGTFNNGANPGAVNFDGGVQLTSKAGETDMFLARLEDGINATVTWAIDSSSGPAGAQVQGPRIAVDGTGNVVLAGTFSGSFALLGSSVTALDAQDYYVGSVTTTGQFTAQSVFLSSINGGGLGTDGPGRHHVGVRTNASGDILIAGQFTGTTDFDPISGNNARTSKGKNDLFLSVYNRSGFYMSTETYGGVDDDKFLALGSAGGGFMLAGTFEGTVTFALTDISVPLTSVGSDDIALLTINGSGRSIDVQRLSMENGPSGSGIFADAGKGGGFALAGLSNGTFIHGGAFRGTLDVDPGTAAKNVTSKSGVDFYLAQFFPDGLSEQPLLPPGLGLGFALGGAGDQAGAQVATDASGRIYLAGFFNGTVDFDPGPAVVNRTASDPGGNYFLAQFSPDGQLRWVQQIATVMPDDDPGLKLALDVSGNAYLAGEYETSASVGGFTVTNADAADGRDIFLFRFDVNGVTERAATFGGSGGDEFVDVLGVDPSSGTLVMGGTFASLTDFDPNAGTLLRAPNGSPGNINGFVLALDSSGNIRWFHQVAGTAGFGGPEAVGFLTTGDVIIAGNFSGTVDLDFGNSPVPITGNLNDDDIFLAKYDSSSGAILTTRVIGGSRSDEVAAIAVNLDNEIFIGGQFTGTLVIDAMPSLIESGDGQGDGFIFKMDDDFGQIGAISIGGAFEDRIGFLGLDANGTLVAAGTFSGRVDFDPGPGAAILSSTLQRDLFIARYDTVTLGFKSAYRVDITDESEGLPGIDGEVGGAIFVDPTGNTYFTGAFSGSVDADVSAGVRKFASKGGFDLLFAKFSPENLGDASHGRGFRDADGDEITLLLSGPGSVVYTLANGAGDFANAILIELSDTTLATTFTITVKQAGNGDGTTPIAVIRTTGTNQHLGTVIFSDGVLIGDGAADLVPDFLITGASRSLKLGDLNANAFVKLGQDLPYNVPDNTTPDTYNNHPDLTIDRVADNGAVIELIGDGTPGGKGGGGLGKVVVGSWASPGFIRTSQSVGSLTVLRDNFMATIQLDPGGLGEGTEADMGSISVQNGGWGSSGNEVEGSIGSFSAEAFLAGATIKAGSIGKITITDGAFEGSLELTDPVSSGTKAFTVNSNFSGSIVTEAPLKSLKIKGNFTGSLKAPTIGSISAFSFVGTTMNPTEFHSIETKAGPLGVLKSTVGGIKDYVLDTAGGFGGITVKLSKLNASTVGLDNVSIKAASIGKINVSLTAAKTAAGIDLTGIRGSKFITRGIDTKGVLRGNIGAISVAINGVAAGANATGIVDSTFDARVDLTENVALSTVNLLTGVKVAVKGQGGLSVGIEGSEFLGDIIGATSVVVSRGKAPASTAFAVGNTTFRSDGAIGAMTFQGDATAAQVIALNVMAGAGIGPVTVKSKDPTFASLTSSAILAGQSLDLTGGSEKELRAALAKSNLASVNVAGSLLETSLVAGASIGTVTVGGEVRLSQIIAGAKFGDDFLLDGDETYQRAAAIAAVTVKGTFRSSSIVAGVNPVNGIFGDADDAVAVAAGVLDDTSAIGAVNLSGVLDAPVPATLAGYQFGIQAAAIKSLKTAAATLTDFTVAQFLESGTAGEDPLDIIVRLRG